MGFEEINNPPGGSEKFPERNRDLINKERLNNIIRSAKQKDALFGKEVNLDSYDKKQLGLVALLVDEQMDEFVQNDSEWKRLNETINRLTREGSIMSFDFPPSWLVNGGEKTKEARIEYNEKGVAKIIVPENLFRVYYWKGIAHRVRKYSEYGNEVTIGMAAGGLAEDLSRLASFLKQTEKYKKES